LTSLYTAVNELLGVGETQLQRVAAMGHIVDEVLNNSHVVLPVVSTDSWTDCACHQSYAGRAMCALSID
jgi:hypothetical protein